MMISKSNYIKKIISNTNIHICDFAFAQLNSEWAAKDVISPFNRLYYINSGEGYINFDRNELILKPGNVYLIPCNTVFSYSCKTNLEKVYVHLNTEYFGIDIFSHLNKVCSIPLKNDLKPYFSKDLEDSYENAFNFKLVVIDSLSCFINQNSESINSYLNSFSEYLEVLKYISENLDARLKIDSICHKFGYSNATFYKKFKNDNNISLKKYIEKQLVQKVQNRLLTTNLTIKGIAQELHFCDEYYMSKFFKLFTNMSPTEYRKQMKVN